jgi:hypothetical protein
VAAAVQAIQQAPDPSAAVAAFANGVALEGKQPNIYAAYISRMVDLGLPELAFHQAQTLTTLQSSNGLAWAVIAFVNARKANMPDAISAINWAGKFAPDNRFVQHTAGEIIAWYDVKADQASLPMAAKDGLAKTRGLTETSPAYIAAYETAKEAYDNQARTETQPPMQAAPEYQPGAQPQPEAQPPVSPDYVPQSSMVYAPEDYYGGYDGGFYGSYYGGYYWGPGWGAPPPWWWWPQGSWWWWPTFTVGFVFHSDNFHHHHDHDGHFHDGHFHDGHFHDAHFASHGNPAFWHHDPAGGTTFFGTPAHPMVQSSSRSVQHAPMTTDPSSRTSHAAGQRNVFAMPAPTGHASGGTMPHAVAVPQVWSGGMAGPGWSAPSGHWAGPSGRMPSGGAPQMMAPAGGFHGGGAMGGGGSHGGGGAMGGGGHGGGGGGHGGR